MAGLKWSVGMTAGGAITGTDQLVGLAGSVDTIWTFNQMVTFAWASPTLVTPTLGVATATSINKVALTAPATSATLTIANGKTLTASNSLTLAGTDSTVLPFPSTSAPIARTDAANSFVGVQVVASATATPAAGSTAARLLFGTTADFGIYYGSGAPTVSAAQGSLYLRSDGTGVADRAYINNSAGSGTTWTAIATAG